MSDYLPKFDEGPVTVTASAAVTGGQLVTAAGAPAAAGSITWLGVASRDVASGDQFTVFFEGVQYLTASAAIAANTLVKCAANGQVAAFVDGTDDPLACVGLTLEAASGAGDLVATRMTR